MSKLAIPRDALVVVGDGQKALFLRNKGDEKAANFAVVRAFHDDNPSSHEQGTDRPGRSFARASTHRRSSVATTDWHKLEKERFVERVASATARLVRAEGIKAIVLVAPSRVLSELRHALPDEITDRVIAVLDKDLTQHPVWDIEKHLVG